jgi:hypothetical protein
MSFEKYPIWRSYNMKSLFISNELCKTCNRDGHGPTDRECQEYYDELKKYFVGCWSPRGTVQVWDDQRIG